MSYGSEFTLTLFTNDPEQGIVADQAGVDRIGLDLETLGKRERQGGSSSWISHHQVEDLPALRACLHRAALFVRTNPIHPGSADEVEMLLAEGARVLMLPMFRRAREVQEFVELVAGRAMVVPLLETAAAAARIEQVIKVPGIEEIHVGLNDLYLDLGLDNHFEVLVSPLMEILAGTIREAGIRLSFGGIGRSGDKRLPIPADLVYAQYPRLGGTGALLSRVFTTERPEDLLDEVPRARQRLDYWDTRPREELRAARHDLISHTS